MVGGCKLISGRGRLLGPRFFFLLLWFVVVAGRVTVEVANAIVLVFMVAVYYYFNELFILF